MEHRPKGGVSFHSADKRLCRAREAGTAVSALHRAPSAATHARRAGTRNVGAALHGGTLGRQRHLWHPCRQRRRRDGGAWRCRRRLIRRLLLSPAAALRGGTAQCGEATRGGWRGVWRAIGARPRQPRERDSGSCLLRRLRLLGTSRRGQPPEARRVEPRHTARTICRTAARRGGLRL